MEEGEGNFPQGRENVFKDPVDFGLSGSEGGETRRGRKELSKVISPALAEHPPTLLPESSWT